MISKKLESLILKSTRLKYLYPCSSLAQKLSQKNLLHPLLFNHIPVHSGENFDILELYIQMVYNLLSSILQRDFPTIVSSTRPQEVVNFTFVCAIPYTVVYCASVVFLVPKTALVFTPNLLFLHA